MVAVPVRFIAVPLILTVLVGIPWAGEEGAETGAQQPRESSCLDSTHVVVDRLAIPIPADSAALSRFLWKRYIWGPDMPHFDCPLENWKPRADTFVRAMLEKAESDSLPVESLSRCLAFTQEGRDFQASLPIRATYAMCGGKPVWIILLKWEYDDPSYPGHLVHGEVFVFDVESWEVVAFETCN